MTGTSNKGSASARTDQVLAWVTIAAARANILAEPSRKHTKSLTRILQFLVASFHVNKEFSP